MTSVGLSPPDSASRIHFSNIAAAHPSISGLQRIQGFAAVAVVALLRVEGFVVVSLLRVPGLVIVFVVVCVLLRSLLTIRLVEVSSFLIPAVCESKQNVFMVWFTTVRVD